MRRWTVKAKVDIFEMDPLLYQHLHAFMYNLHAFSIRRRAPSKDYVIFPMNIAESHWAMGAIDLKEKGFRYFDSMFSCSEASKRLQSA